MVMVKFSITKVKGRCRHCRRYRYMVAIEKPINTMYSLNNVLCIIEMKKQNGLIYLQSRYIEIDTNIFPQVNSEEVKIYFMNNLGFFEFIRDDYAVAEKFEKYLQTNK